MSKPLRLVRAIPAARSQLSSGLYGPLIVLEPGQSFDPETDRIMLLSVGGPANDAPLLLNGSAQPEPIELRVRTKYRFRFIDIMAANPPLAVSLLSGDAPVSWRAIAKDGADLPSAHATTRPARQVIAVGETYDFEFQPKSPGELRLDIFRRAILVTPESPAQAPPVVLRPESHIQVLVRVREPSDCNPLVDEQWSWASYGRPAGAILHNSSANRTRREHSLEQGLTSYTTSSF